MTDHAGDEPADDSSEIRNVLDSPPKSLFEAVFRAHHASLVQYLRRKVGSDADARDLAQEAYLRLLRYDENQDADSLRALLFRIATNLVSMRARTARVQRWVDHQPLENEPALPTQDPSPERHLIAEEQLDRLMQAIQRLPPKCQQVFVLSRFHDMSYPQIAQRCGISVKMVEKHITKALEMCRIEVGGELP